ncbi:MAG: hypothetical protein K9K67_14870 [Bacteriovoracaceae bacterium]|nr:hypothetical protein [Bacteriovoracaceae bacterium]
MDQSTKKTLLDEQYRGLTGRSNASPSLFSFLKNSPLSEWLQNRISDGPWCELGCGNYSLFEEGEQLISGLSYKEDIFGFDLSSVAIEQAPHSNIQYKQADCSQVIPGGGHSFILDGHFLHCLSSLPEVFQTLGVISDALLPGAIYAGEVMTSHKKLSFDHDLYFDSKNSVLFQDDRPIRVILEAREWESLFKDAGLEIIFFICQASIKMIPHREREIPMSGDPECLRFILKKPQ